MAMKTYHFSYKGTVTPTHTTFLTAQPLTMDFDGDLDLDETDASHFKTIDSEFQKTMKNLIANQLGFLNGWLKEKQALLEGVKSGFEKWQKEAPTDAQAIQQRQKKLDELKLEAEKIPKLEKDYKFLVENWAENCRHQQGLRAMMLAVKSARVRVFNEKCFRVRAGVAVKASLLIAPLILSIVALIASAASTNPAFVILSGIGVCISGGVAIAQISKMVFETIDMEKRTMEEVKKDVAAVRAAFDGAKGKGSTLAKHATELHNLMKIRQDNIAKIRFQLLKYEAQSSGILKAIEQLKTDKTVSREALEAKTKQFGLLTERIRQANKEISSLEHHNEDAEKLLRSLKELNVSLETIVGQAPNSIWETWKNHFTNLDNLANWFGSLGGSVSSISGIHS